MKKIFPGFYSPSATDFKQMWKKAIFVLDANVILNLYRYPSEASQELIKVLENIKSRIWIPYQVALEYQKNRLKVIAEQKKRYYEVIKALGDTKDNLSHKFDELQLKKRHSYIDPDEILESINKVLDEHIDKINSSEKNQLSVTDEDSIRIKIDEILKDKIGKPYEEQKILDELYKDGEKRFAAMIPPGYMDRKKGNDKEPEIFSYGNLVYNRKYGDYIVWKQILEFSKESKSEYIIFLTDDDKEDWWLNINSLGDKRVGPRPELIQEIISYSGVKNFYMYNSEQFLKYAKDYLQATVSDESINQVRIISKTENKLSDFNQHRNRAAEAEKAVYNWILAKYPLTPIESNFRSFPDFLVDDQNTNRKIGFEVKYVRNLQMVAFRMKDFVYQGYYETNKNDIDELNYIIVVDDKDDAFTYLKRFQSRKTFPENVKVIVGNIVHSSVEGEKIFEPFFTID